MAEDCIDDILGITPLPKDLGALHGMFIGGGVNLVVEVMKEAHRGPYLIIDKSGVVRFKEIYKGAIPDVQKLLNALRNI